MLKTGLAERQSDPWAALEEDHCRHCGQEIRLDEAEVLVLRADSLQVARFHRWGCGVKALEWARSEGTPPDLLFLISPAYRTCLPAHIPSVSGRQVS